MLDAKPIDEAAQAFSREAHRLWSIGLGVESQP
jgi:hypothetical protein